MSRPTAMAMISFSGMRTLHIRWVSVYACADVKWGFLHLPFFSTITLQQSHTAFTTTFQPTTLKNERRPFFQTKGPRNLFPHQYCPSLSKSSDRYQCLISAHSNGLVSYESECQSSNLVRNRIREVVVSELQQSEEYDAC